jgi:hypothetical protein
MNPELEQARSALKSMAEARRSGKPIDLSNLPEPLRKKLQAQLDRLPPEMQKELLAKGSPILDKAVESVSHHPRVLPLNYTGHYNQTVQPGDRLQLTIGRVLMFFGAVAAIYYIWLQFGATTG